LYFHKTLKVYQNKNHLQKIAGSFNHFSIKVKLNIHLCEKEMNSYC